MGAASSGLESESGLPPTAPGPAPLLTGMCSPAGGFVKLPKLRARARLPAPDTWGPAPFCDPELEYVRTLGEPVPVLCLAPIITKYTLTTVQLV